MRTLLLSAFLLFWCLGVGSARGGQFTNRYDAMVTTDGQEYERVRPQRIEGKQLVFFYSSGIGRVDLSVLPDNVLADIGLPTRDDRQRHAEEQARLDADQRAKGFVKYEDKWVSPEERDRGRAESEFREHVKTENDRFKGTKTYTARHLASADGMPRESSLFLYFQLTEEQNGSVDRTPHVALVLEHSVFKMDEASKVLDTLNTALSIWRYEDKRDLLCIADGERLDLGTPGYKRTLEEHGTDNFYREIMWSTVSLETFGKIASARKLEMRLGGDELTVPFEERKSMQVFADFIERRVENQSVEPEN